MLNVYIYGKTTEDISAFKEVVELIDNDDMEIIVTTENKRSFRELERIKQKCKKTDLFIIGSIMSLGMNYKDIAEQLAWFIQESVCLIIKDTPSTYEFGVSQPMNKATISAILQSLVQMKNITLMPKRTNAGRNKVSFPDDWDELYEKWEKKEISSKMFIEMTGLKKATFYNLLTEYKELLAVNRDYKEQIKRA